MTLPTTLIAGDTWEWETEYGDYPAGTWTATAYFENSAESFSVSSTADGTTHVFAAAATATDDFKPGSYYVQVRVVSGGESYTVESRWVEVKPDPASSVKFDHRSTARKSLDQARALLLAMTETGIYSGSIAGRSYTREQLPQLYQLIRDLEAQVRLEEQGSAAGVGRDIKVRYGLS